jgi:transcriptional regulator NrdR family protein
MARIKIVRKCKGCKSKFITYENSTKTEEQLIAHGAEKLDDGTLKAEYEFNVCEHCDDEF